MAVTTAVVLVVLLRALGSLASASHGILAAAAACGLSAAACFGLPRLLVGALPAAAIGLVLYAGLLGVWRPAGLRAAWAYLRHLR